MREYAALDQYNKINRLFRNRLRAPRHGQSLVASYPPGTIALWQNACAAACVLPIALAIAAIPSARDVVLLLVLGLACTALAHTLFIASLRTLSAHTASVVTALEPVYGIAFLLLGETLGARTIAGAVLLVGAALWASRRR